MDYDLGAIDLEQKTLPPIDNPFGTRLLVACELCDLAVPEAMVW